MKSGEKLGGGEKKNQKISNPNNLLFSGAFPFPLAVIETLLCSM